MLDQRFLTKEEIREIAIGAIGKTFAELSDENFNYNNKGTFGQLLEKSIFKFANNSDSAPDFIEAGIELKLTPYKKNKNGTLSAKERLVLNIINYMTECEHEFMDSHFMFKNKNIQLLWYLYEANKEKKKFTITNELFLSLEEKEFADDLKIIKQDWQYIVNKIKKGEAHNLSEGDTMYLGACPKGKDKKSLREQPFSEIKAMQRAFCYKQSYMTYLVRKYISNEKAESIIKDSLEEKPFEQYIIEKLQQYFGKSEKDLFRTLNVNTTAKNKYRVLLSKMLKVDGDIEKSAEFQKANIKIKTIRVEKNGKIKESMSFPSFEYNAIIKEKWGTSELHDIFENTKFLFVVFKNNGKNYIFDKVKIWNMPEVVLEKEVQKVWKKTRKIIKDGNIVREIVGGRCHTNFPKITENGYCHVRPHAVNTRDTYPLPVKDKLTRKAKFMKHCFWLNSSYIEKIIGE